MCEIDTERQKNKNKEISFYHIGCCGTTNMKVMGFRGSIDNKNN